MKRIIGLCAAMLMTASVFAQAPNKMSYQAVIRDASNTLVVNQTIGMRISILQGTSNGTAVYVETQNPTTNANGLASLEIGGGTLVSGDFANINWANGPYFIKTETDPAGGSNYSITGTSQLLSVPYAMYAQTSGSSIPGPQGPIGPQGPQGNDGAQGAPGPQGPAGATGPQGSIGLTGPAGPQGATGLTGPQGPQGPAGASGANGTNGIDGKTVLNGTSNPTALIGNNGDFFINTSTNTIFGPKAAGAWPATGVSLVGPQGATGPAGPQGPQGPSGGGGGFTHYIGEPFGGGVIFYLEKDTIGTEHGLVCHPEFLCQACSWSNITTSSIGSLPSSGNYGNYATNGLVWSNLIVGQNGHTNSAAKLCLDLVSNGYNDWYLPSIDELYQLWTNRYAVIKGLSKISGAATLNGATFWSSYEYNNAQAFYMSFLIGASVHAGTINKSASTLSVRAIRAF
ncbi:MAG: hypothetical protein ACK5CO_05065 [Bacteroidota bacterium]